MLILVNYSHKLSKSTLGQIEAKIGENVKEVLIPFELDENQSLVMQLERLINQCPRPFDLLIPPSYNIAAAYITARLSSWRLSSNRPYPPSIVILQRTGIDIL
jgi:hypothetical protein